jgi:hypothetical protein
MKKKSLPLPLPPKWANLKGKKKARHLEYMLESSHWLHESFSSQKSFITIFGLG